MLWEEVNKEWREIPPSPSPTLRLCPPPPLTPLPPPPPFPLHLPPLQGVLWEEMNKEWIDKQAAKEAALAAEAAQPRTAKRSYTRRQKALTPAENAEVGEGGGAMRVWCVSLVWCVVAHVGVCV